MFWRLSPRPGGPRNHRPVFKRLCARLVWGSVAIPIFQHSRVNIDGLIQRDFHVPRPELNTAATPGPGEDVRTGRRATETRWPKRLADQGGAAVSWGPLQTGGGVPWRWVNLRSVRRRVCAERLIDANNYETQNCAIPARTTPVRHV